MHLTIKERVELVLMSGADGATNRSVAKKFNRIYLAKKFCFNKNVCYYYLNCFICFGALFMAHPVYFFRSKKMAVLMTQWTCPDSCLIIVSRSL